MPASPVEQARRINRTWIVHGGLDRDADRYLQWLEETRPDILEDVCARAVAAARAASAEHRDPKSDFYTALFSRATPAEREEFLGNHLWTRHLSEALETIERLAASQEISSPGRSV